jgi:hypothetical protein
LFLVGQRAVKKSENLSDSVGWFTHSVLKPVMTTVILVKDVEIQWVGV